MIKLRPEVQKFAEAMERIRKDRETMTGCELIKCPWYIGGKCTEPNDHVDKYSGEDICSGHPDAIPREEFEGTE